MTEAWFTLKPENDGNTHASSQLPRAVPSHLSVFGPNQDLWKLKEAK